MPAYRAEQTHPLVNQHMGPVKTNVCWWSENDSTIVDEALGKLKGKADAKGATALIDFRYRMIETHPRVTTCRRFLQAEAMAVHLDGTGAQAARD